MRAYLPSPSQSEIHLGPFPLRGYALCIILGVFVAVFIADRRLQRRGYAKGLIADIAVYAVPAGLIGARLYHVITDPEIYFGGGGKKPYEVFFIWEGGLGIWGAVAGGALGAWYAARKHGVSFTALADSCAVALPVAQAIGRFGNWFNQELYGRPSTLPWALHIDAAHRLPGYETIATYQPTFLYEALWDLGTAGVVLLAERRWRLGRGRAFALYVAVYTVGRGWIEALRIDHANRYLGLRLNDYTSIAVFIAAVVFLVLVRDRPTPHTEYRQPTDELADPVEEVRAP